MITWTRAIARLKEYFDLQHSSEPQSDLKTQYPIMEYAVTSADLADLTVLGLVKSVLVLMFGFISGVLAGTAVIFRHVEIMDPITAAEIGFLTVLWWLTLVVSFFPLVGAIAVLAMIRLKLFSIYQGSRPIREETIHSGSPEAPMQHRPEPSRPLRKA